jgi:LysW-gamma-L-lysine carboxypeptidase
MDNVSFLEELVAIPSPSGEEDDVAEYLVGRMTALGFEAHRDEVGNVVGVVGDPGAEADDRRPLEIVLLGHMDTVPGEVPVQRCGDLLYGRGAVDAKGPLAAFVLAAAQAAPRLRNARVMVIGTVEEEANGEGAHHLAGTMQPPDFVIIGEPSDWMGITLGYKGRLCVDYELTQSCSHGAGAQTGPAEQAVSFWNRVTDYAEAHNEGRSGRFTTLDPALRDFQTTSDGLNDRVTMRVALRLPPGFEASVIRWKMKQWCDGASLTFSPLDRPFQGEKNTPLVRAFLRAIRAKGGKPRFKLKTGTSDMNVVGPAWGCPIVAYGPGDSSLDHTPNEHIDVREFERAIEVLVQVLETLGV